MAIHQDSFLFIANRNHYVRHATKRNSPRLFWGFIKMWSDPDYRLIKFGI